MRKRVLSVLLICILSLGYSAQVFATSVSEVKQEQEETQEQLEEVNERMEGIENQKDVVAKELTVLDTQLVDILTSISICEDEIAAKEDQIDEVKVELEAAQEKELTQYEDMKTRIRFMYEKGDQAYVQIFLEAGSLPDMLNKASYVEKLYEYDRELLQEFQNTKLEVEAYKEELELEEADILTSQKELKEQQQYLENIIAEKRATVANFDSQLVQAKQEAKNYKEQIKIQNERIRQLEEEEREEQEEESLVASNPKTEAGEGAANTPQESNQNSSEAENGTEEGTGSAGSGLGEQIASYGCQFIGNPYVYGGTSLTSGTDCSGFTQSVYAHFGIRIPRDSTSQRFAGTGVSYEQARPGDLICYAGHVALYIGKGQIVHASTEKTGIKISNATYRTILAVRRIAV